MRRTFAALLVPVACSTGLLAGHAGRLNAQTRGRAPLVLELPGSTRALSMGGAFPLGGNASDAIFYNPAFPGTMRGISIAAQWFGGRSSLFGASAATNGFGGVFAFGLQATDYAVTQTVLAGGWTGENVLASSGDIPVAERVASLAYVRRMWGIRWGMTGKLVEERNAGERAALVAADVGVGRSLGPFEVGLAARNLGRTPSVMGEDLPLPDRVTLAVATPRSTQVGPLDVGLAADLSRLHSDRWAAGGGLEVSWWPIVGRTFTGRIGYRYQQDAAFQHLTLGAGFTGDRVSIDYAWTRDADDVDVHRVGLRWR